MKRHEALADLSRDHHHALVLARALQSATSALPAAPHERVAHLRRVWDRELAPHFVREERVLVPLGACGPRALRDATDTVLDDHAALRELFSTLEAHKLEAQGRAISERLASHVRFEERVWYPALQDALDDDTLARAGRRLQPQPMALIAGYHTDEDGVWVADLDCGHARHIRHEPPFQNAAWVSTAAGRASMLSTAVPCPLCRMPSLPDGLQPHRETAIFDDRSVPRGLRHSHRLKPDTWGLIVVEEGRVLYVLEDDESFAVTLRPGVMGVVAPTRPHHVEPQPGARFFVRFLRCARPDG